MSLYRRSEALVLRRESLNESDRRYTVLTQTYGKVVLKARGAEKIISKLAGSLEPPSLVTIAFVAGRSTNTLIAADMDDSYPTIRSSAERLSDIGFINETISAMLAEAQGDQAVWDLVVSVYRELDDQRMVSPILGAFFVIRLLTILGLAPRFDRDAARGGKLEPRHHRFSLHHGGLVAAAAEDGALSVSTDAIKVLRLLQQGDLETTRRLRAPEPVVREASRVAAKLLAFHRPEAARSMVVMQALATPRP